jgi:hypothetical protein
MIVKTHLIPIKKEDSNKGGCKKMIEYLAKENDQFFSHTETNIKKKDAINLIDEHSKGQLGKKDSKWYAPLYAFSNEESQHICFILFNRNVNDYEELSKDEQRIYNNYIIELGRRFQDEMAENFDKSELGIVSGADLVYVGVVENKRKYSYDDAEVKAGVKKNGDSKTGFNTHIHIVQSRKANNIKKSKISPDNIIKSRSKENFGDNVKSGFNKDNFFFKIEKAFDRITKFNRDIENTYVFKKEQKHKLKNTKNKKINKMAKFYTDEMQKEILSKVNIVDYFLTLVDRGVLQFEGKEAGQFSFRKHGQDTGSIKVNEQKQVYNDFSGKGGGIIAAVMEFDKKKWIETFEFLEKEAGFLNYDFTNINPVEIKASKSKPKAEIKFIKSEPISNKYIIDYFKGRGISENVIKLNIEQVTYSNNGKVYSSGGIANVKGSYNVSGGYKEKRFKTIVGEHNDISYIPGITNKVKIFEGLLDYLSWLELEDKTKNDDNIIILNSTSNFVSAFEILLENKFSEVGILVDGDKAGNEFVEKMYNEPSLKELVPTFKDLREQFFISDKIDLNDRLKIEQVKEISRQGFKL